MPGQWKRQGLYIWYAYIYTYVGIYIGPDISIVHASAFDNCRQIHLQHIRGSLLGSPLKGRSNDLVVDEN